jgi:ATP adenylyltransferase
VTSPDPAALGSAGPADIDVSGRVGVPDSFERIWAPHRMSYINGEGKPAGDPADPLVCPFCVIPGKTDEDGLIVARGSLVYAVLNLYPYNAGHLMIVPFRHLADITDLTVAEAAELMLFTQRAVATLQAATTVQGFNLGMNLGAVAGAGIAAHLHHHVVPRWGGDLNFMPIIGRTRVLPQLLGDTRRILAAAWPTSGS